MARHNVGRARDERDSAERNATDGLRRGVVFNCSPLSAILVCLPFVLLLGHNLGSPRSSLTNFFKAFTLSIAVIRQLDEFGMVIVLGVT